MPVRISTFIGFFAYLYNIEQFIINKKISQTCNLQLNCRFSYLIIGSGNFARGKTNVYSKKTRSLR